MREREREVATTEHRSLVIKKVLVRQGERQTILRPNNNQYSSRVVFSSMYR